LAFDNIFPTDHQRSFLSVARKPAFNCAALAQTSNKSHVANSAIRRIAIAPRNYWITAFAEIPHWRVSNEELKTFSRHWSIQFDNGWPVQISDPRHLRRKRTPKTLYQYALRS